MTVSELIQALSQYPGDMEVLRDDFEAGACGTDHVESIVYPEWSEKIADQMRKYGVDQRECVVIR